MGEGDMERDCAANGFEKLIYDHRGALLPWRDLSAQQTVLEWEMTEQGRARHMARVAASARAGRRADEPAGVAFVDRHTVRLAEAIEALLEQAREAKSGRPSTSISYLRMVSPRQAAYLTLRNLINVTPRGVALSKAALIVADAIEDEARCQAIRLKDSRRFEKLLKLADRRASHRARRAFFISAAERFDPDWAAWPARDRELLGVQLIDLVIEHVGLIELYDKFTATYQVKQLRIRADAQEWLHKIDERTAVMRPVYEPMLIPPRPWREPWSGGYLTRFVRPLPFVKSRGHSFLEDLSSQEMPNAYAAVTAAQNTGWRVNRRLLDVIETLWRTPPEGWENAGSGVGALALAMREATPTPEAPRNVEGMSSEARKHAMSEYGKRRRLWEDAEQARISKTSSLTSALRSARRFSRFERLYFPMNVDFRGRLYAAPSFNPQGPDVMRALLEFSKGERLGAEGWKWLAIHLCNCGDFEKMSKAPLGRRVEWVLKHEERVLTCAADPLSDLWWTHADQPFQFLAACFEWAGYVERGENFKSRLPVALDGACSGIQHFSLALRDAEGGRLI